MNKTPIDLRYRKLGPKVVRALEARFFEAYYFDETQDAVTQFWSLIPKTDTVSWGGSLTLSDLNLTQLASEKGYTVIDRDKAATIEERNELQRQALSCGTFITGTNAISEDGQLVNIDGMGNRVAAMIYGPRQVIIVAGMNKVAKTLDDAMVRARTIAAPLNMQRFGDRQTPCAKYGSCGNCTSTDSICSFIVTTRLCRPAKRIKVILIGTDLGL
ncbi:lactate utilization protein [Breznakiellaceae bacterium SP9]